MEFFFCRSENTFCTIEWPLIDQNIALDIKIKFSFKKPKKKYCTKYLVYSYSLDSFENKRNIDNTEFL